MNGAVIAGFAIAGAAVGFGLGALSVQLERIEGLEAEEDEERRLYEEEARQGASTGLQADPPAPWEGERYGWSFLERFAAPLLGATGFAAFAAHEDVSHVLAIHLTFVALFVLVTVFDVKHRLILDRVSYPGAALAVALSPVTPGLTLWTSVVGAVAVFVVFALQSLLLGGSVLGMGDAKLGAVVGGVTGLGFDLDHLGALYAVIGAVMSAGAVAVVLLVTRVRGLRDPIPYGPFLCAGAALIMFHGPSGP